MGIKIVTQQQMDENRMRKMMNQNMPEIEPDERDDEGNIVFTIDLPEWLRSDKRLASRRIKAILVERRERAIKVNAWASINESEYCNRCGRVITHPASKLIGYGQDCVQRVGSGFEWILKATTLTPAEIMQIKERSKVDTFVRDLWLPLASVTINGVPGNAKREVNEQLDKANIKEPPRKPISVTTKELTINNTEARWIAVECDMKYKDVCVALKERHRGARWNPTIQAWIYPYSRDAANDIMEHFGAIARNVSDDIRELVRIADIENESQAIKLNDDLPNIPNAKMEAWNHQKKAYWFAQNLPGCMLAMQMGCGKSAVVVHDIANSDGQLYMIIAPKSVVRGVWPGELKKHTDIDMNVIPLVKGVASHKRDIANVALQQARKSGKKVVFIISYQSAAREDFLKWALKQTWDGIYLDESHKIKAPRGVQSVACGKLGKVAKRRRCLTGTPMPHSPLDIWAQFRFLDPSIFGPSFTAFKAEYANFINRGQYDQIIGYKNQEQMNRKLYSIAYRITKQEALDLPEEMTVERRVKLEPSAAKLYKSMAEELIALVEEGSISASNILVKLLRLSQITGGSVNDDNGMLREVSKAKENELAEIMDDFDVTEPLVVFCRFKHDLRVVKRVAESQGRSYCELSGDRNELESFQKGRADVIGVNIAAGGVGVDLTRAAYDIYYSVGYGLGEYDQAMSRIHRPGQTRPVTHIRLIASGTVDERIYAALQNKADIVSEVLNLVSTTGLDTSDEDDE